MRMMVMAVMIVALMIVALMVPIMWMSLPVLIVMRRHGVPGYSTVTDLARLRGLSTSVPRNKAVW